MWTPRLGVCVSDVDIEGFVNKTSKGWGCYQSNGNIGHSGAAGKSYASAFGDNSVVEVEVDEEVGLEPLEVVETRRVPRLVEVGEQLAHLSRVRGWRL